MTGQYVKEKIEQSGVSLAEVARRLGISPQNLTHRLSVKDIKVSVLIEIARAIDKELAYFVEGYDPLKDNPTSTEQSASPTGLASMEQLLAAKDELITALQQTISIYEWMMGRQDNNCKE